MEHCRRTSFLSSRGMRGVPYEGQLFRPVLARNWYFDLSIRAIRKLLAKDIRKPSDASQAKSFACLPISYAVALSLWHNATSTAVFHILPFQE